MLQQPAITRSPQLDFIALAHFYAAVPPQCAGDVLLIAMSATGGNVMYVAIGACTCEMSLL